MALHTIGKQIRTRAILKAYRIIGGGRQGSYRLNISDGCREITGVAEGLKLVRRAAWISHIAVQLGSVQSQRVTGDRSVASQTFRSGGVMPNLGIKNSSIVDHKSV